jgi:hypothetical protein
MGRVIRAGDRAPTVLWGLALLWTMLAVAGPQIAAAASVSPLPESDFMTRSACSAPIPGHAGCMALELVPHAAAARAQVNSLAGASGARPGLTTAAECAAAFPSACLTPQDLRSAYFPSEQPVAPTSNAQTIALVDAYNDPKAEADLAVYDKQFGLPAIHACSANEGGCFEQVGQSGTSALPFPKSETARESKEAVCVTAQAKETESELKVREEACDELVEAEGWAVEISTDIEVAHAVCQNCKILLVEASSPSYPDLEGAEETAVKLGATEISNSWGGMQDKFDGHTFNHRGTVITAAAGDDGYLNWTEAEAAEKAMQEGRETSYFAGADYPASSPDVVAVGGTKLTLNGGVRQSETVWNEDPSAEGENQGAGGGGCSESPTATAQPWQQAVPDWSQVGCGTKRAVADVSADADPYTGVAVYDSVPTIQEETPGNVINAPLEWWPVGGTSVASPIIASMFALAGGAHGVAYPAQTLYSHLGSSLLHDVTTGGNGDCDDNYLTCSGSLTSPLDCGAGMWICNATTGYDGPTGVGTPNGIGAFKVIEGGEPKGLPVEEPGTSKGSSSSGSSSGGSENPSGAGGNGSGVGGNEGGAGSQTSGSSPTGGSTSSGGSTQSGPPGTSNSLPSTISSAVRLSALTLTANARAALHHRTLTIAQLAFSCVLSRAATVRATLSIQVRSAGHTHWRTLPASLTFAAVRGLNHRRLPGSGELSPGIYRLTLTPAGGTARSIAIRVA